MPGVRLVFEAIGSEAKHPVQDGDLLNTVVGGAYDPAELDLKVFGEAFLKPKEIRAGAEDRKVIAMNDDPEAAGAVIKHAW